MMLLLSEKYGFHIQIHYLLVFYPVSHFQLYYYFETTCNAGYPGLIPGWGRSPGEGNSNPLQYSFFVLQYVCFNINLFILIGMATPLQYSCLENFMDRGAWQVTVHGVKTSQTRLSKWHTHTHTHISQQPELSLPSKHRACDTSWILMQIGIICPSQRESKFWEGTPFHYGTVSSKSVSVKQETWCGDLLIFCYYNGHTLVLFKLESVYKCPKT